MNDIEERVAALPTGLDAETMIEIRQTVREDMERSFGPSTPAWNEIVNVNKRFDEQSIAQVQHLNETTAALALRMTRARAHAQAFGERLNAGKQELTPPSRASPNRRRAQHRAAGEDRPGRVTRRRPPAELEGRIGEDLGTKIANSRRHDRPLAAGSTMR